MSYPLGVVESSANYKKERRIIDDQNSSSTQRVLEYTSSASLTKMKVFVVLSCVLAVAVARPSHLVAPVAYHHAPVAYAAPVAYHAPVAVAAPVSVSSQFHAQDSLGQYNYGYADHLSSKVEGKSFDGVTRGAYSYVDAEGKVQKVEYTADDVNGFQVKASNLPVAPVAPAVPAVPVAAAPEPVQDTPEVAKAKEEHFAHVEEAKARLAAEEKIEQIAAAVAPVSYVAPAVTTYTAPVVAAPVTYTAAAPVTYTAAAYPYNYAPYGHFGYHYTSAAPVFGHAYHPFHVAAPVVPVAQAPAVSVDSVVKDEDTVEVKAE